MSKREIQIIEIEWQEIGDEDNPRSRLLTSIEICGCPMHLEAVAVLEGERRSCIDTDASQQEYEDAPEWVQAAIAASADGEAVQTVEIAGRSYVLIATPFQQ